jgi:hypothetical protein
MKEIKIICDSEITIREYKDRIHVYKDEEEVQADLNAKPEDIKRDVKIIVPDIPLFNKS